MWIMTSCLNYDHHHHVVACPVVSIAISMTWHGAFATFLCTEPCRVESTFEQLWVKLSGADPGPSKSASPAAPVHWETVGQRTSE